MNRNEFIRLLGLSTITGLTMNMKTLSHISDNFSATETMPVLFLGHGSPMNAIEDNEFSESWKNLGNTIPKPNAIICISAHWETAGTFVTAMPKPKTIHDFGGFPKALFDVQYPAPGEPELAGETSALLKSAKVGLDTQWGLDHGAWSVIMNIYPKADIPIIQLSLDYHLSPRGHYELAKELKPLRNKGILIIGSGNIVHNLNIIDWRHPDSGFDWAVTANQKLKDLIINRNSDKLIDYEMLGKEVRMAVPTNEHYLPMLYSMAQFNNNEEISLFNDKTVMGSLAMTSFKISG